jgi:hypothetical protein
MPNTTTSRQLARIRAQYDAQQAALNARRYEGLKHLIESPIAHFSGVRQDVLVQLRANRDAFTAQDAGLNMPVTTVSNSQFFFPRNAPQVGSLVEHELFGLGMVEGKPFAAANAGMALAVFFDEVDRTAIVFADELEMLDGDLVGDSADHDSTVASKAAKARIDEGRAQAAAPKYDTDVTEDEFGCLRLAVWLWGVVPLPRSPYYSG